MAQSVFSNKIDVERSVTLYTFLPEEIIIAAGITGRKEDTSIESLAADIYTHGQSTPVLCRKDEANKPVLVYGHRRVKAIAHINAHLLKPGQEQFRVQAKYERLNDFQAFVAAVSENRFREGTTPVDDAFNIEQFQKLYKLSFEKIGEIYFPEAKTGDAKAEAVRWVKVRAGLVELDETAKEAVKDGSLKVSNAAMLAKLPKEKQREVIAEEKAKGTSLKGKLRITQQAVKAAKPAPAPRKPVAAAAPKAPAPAPTPTPALKVPSSVYAAAEDLARVTADALRAIDAYLEDSDSEKAENDLIAEQSRLLAAHTAYRKLVPFRLAASERDTKAA